MKEELSLNTGLTLLQIKDWDVMLEGKNGF